MFEIYLSQSPAGAVKNAGSWTPPSPTKSDSKEQFNKPPR